MSDYTRIYNLTIKDSLPSGNTSKVVKGAELDAELNAVAAAISSKSDINSPTFTGTPAAPTASLGTSTTQLATTAFVQAALNALYPVGSIYINASVSTNPSSLLGFGTWEAFGAGRVMVGIDGTDTDFDTLGETGGSKASVAAHTHTFTTGATSVDHTHTFSSDATSVSHTHTFTSGTESVGHTHSGTTGIESANHTHSGTTSAVSNDHTHSFSGTTGGQSNDHAHYFATSAAGNHTHAYSETPYGGIAAGGGAFRSASYSTGYDYTTSAAGSHTHDGWTGGVNSNHTHGFSGTTSGISANHTHTVTTGGVSANHTHSITTGDRSAAHTHSGTTDGSSNTSHVHTGTTNTSGNTSHVHSGTTASTGNSNGNLQPYVVVRMWKRTA